MENWHLIRQECQDQTQIVIPYLFQRFPSLRKLLKNKILITNPNSYLICYVLEKCTPIGDGAFALNLQALLGRLIGEPQKRLFLEGEFYQQKIQNRQNKYLFALKESNKRVNTQNEIPVNKQLLDQLTYMLDQSNFVLICGPYGCGKTTLLKRYLEDYQLKELTLYMDETIDFQSIIGQFVCTEQIGVFTHKAGPLLYCNKIGALLVLKNYSETNQDFKQQLRRALDLQYVEVNGEKYKIDNLKVVALQKDAVDDEYVITMEQPKDEILNSIDCRYFKEILQNCTPELKQLLKLRKRFQFHLKEYENQQYLPEQVRTKLFIECLEVLKLELFEIFQLDQIKYSTVFQRYEHYIEFSKLGQIEINNKYNTPSFIVYNQYSSRIMEQIMTCILNDEACLLVGDTGCGKTTLTQHCAQLLGKKLHIYNLSEGSDGQDLIGGFRPLNQDTLIKLNFTKFLKYFTQTVDINKNQQFIESLRKLLQTEKYNLLIKCMSETTQQCLAKTKGKLYQKFSKLYKNLNCSVKEMSFYFLTGNMIKAMQKGEWVLIDEINLANNELLQKILPAIEKTQFLFYERGDENPIQIHPDFRIFGCMNPGTDVGKKELPPNIKNKFTTIVCHDLVDKQDIIDFIKGLIGHSFDVVKLAELYLTLKEICKQHQFNLQTFSLRNLARALHYYQNSKQRPQLAMFNGLSLAFGSGLGQDSLELFNQQLILNGLDYKVFTPSISNQNYKILEQYIEIYGFQIPRGSETPIHPDKCEYLITPSNFSYLLSCLRCISGTGIPILLEGPTSGGKTSLIYFIAKICGQRCHRINNHQNTQLEEYLGTYGQVGKSIQFQEGLLVVAMRRGDWIILDELNLARSEILENLNRLLDDNKELFLPETQTTLKPQPKFRIFATQNPVSYSGRKQLSKAFRNRFIEIQVEEISAEGLASILKTRCPYLPETHIPLVRQTQVQLNILRASESLFMGMVTLRDLIKWGNRMKNAESGKECTAMEGYCLIVERVRDVQLRKQLQTIIESIFKVKLHPEKYYEEILNKSGLIDFSNKYNIQWNKSFTRMTALTLKCIANNEPALLVGPPGIGKTTLTAIIADKLNLQNQHIVCHQYLELSDFVGALRPCREEHASTPFSFQDGPLLKCFKDGGVFLIDEVNMCPESVLEGLNSCLEQPATLTVNDQFYQASKTFAIIAAMNPSGDWGKKELTPALRSRFTEIFVFNPLSKEEMHQIVSQFEIVHCSTICEMLLEHEDMTFRDLLQIVEHIKQLRKHGCQDEEAIISESIDFVLDQVRQIRNNLYNQMEVEEFNEVIVPEINAYKLLRAVTIHNKPIMIQGPLQCGKTHIIQYFAKLRGLKCVKILFDEQSDLQELLGTDQPNSSLDDIAKVTNAEIVTEQSAGQFRFVPGPLLEALKKGHWVILKNLNLAPQNVLEGLNSILDHRREIFIPELGQIVQVHENCRLFAIQNPMSCGEGRKGLPLSFLNRFIKIEFYAYSENFKLQLCPQTKVPLSSLQLFKELKFNEGLRDKLLLNTTDQQITTDHVDSSLWAQQRIHFSDIINSVQYLRSILLIGEQHIGKKYLVEKVAKYYNKELQYILLSKQTDSMELLGQYVQGDQESLFKWQFSRLVQAAINGEWVLIDSPNREILPKLYQFLEEDYFTLFGIDIPIHKQFKIFITTDQQYVHHNVKIHMKLHDSQQFRASYMQDIRQMIFLELSELCDFDEICKQYFSRTGEMKSQFFVKRQLQRLRIQIESLLLTQETISQYEISLLCNQVFQSEHTQSLNKISTLINLNIYNKIDNPIIQIKECPCVVDNPVFINQQHYQALIKRIIRHHSNIYLEYFSYNDKTILDSIYKNLLSEELNNLKQQIIKIKTQPKINLIPISDTTESVIFSMIQLNLLNQFADILSQNTINYIDVKLYEYLLRQNEFKFDTSINSQEFTMLKTKQEWETQEIFDHIVFEKRIYDLTNEAISLKQLVNLFIEQLRYSDNLKDFIILLKQCLLQQPLQAVAKWIDSLLKTKVPIFFNEFPVISDQLSLLHHYRYQLRKEVNFEKQLDLDIYQFQTLYNYQRSELMHLEMPLVLKFVQNYIDYLTTNDPKLSSNPLKVFGNDSIQNYIQHLKNKQLKLNLNQSQQLLLQGILQAQLYELPFYKELLSRYQLSRSQQAFQKKMVNEIISIDFFQKIIDLNDDDLMKLSSNEIQLLILRLYNQQLQQALTASSDSQYLLKGYYQPINVQLVEQLEKNEQEIALIQDRLFIRSPKLSNLEATIEFISDLKQELQIIKSNMNRHYIEAWIVQSYDKYFHGFRDFLQPIYEALMFWEFQYEPVAKLQNSGFKYQLKKLSGDKFITYADQQLISQEERDVFKMDDAKMYTLLSRKIKGLVVEQYSDKTVEDEQKLLQQQLNKELNQYKEELEYVGKVTMEELKHNVRQELTQLDILSKEFLDYILELEKSNKAPLIITKMFGRFVLPTVQISDDLHVDAFLYKLQFNKLQDLYKQTDPNEVQQLHDLLMKTLFQIKQIQSDDLFAENEVIAGMGIFIVHLLQQSAYTTPLIKFTTGIEILVQKIEEWDKTVPKEYKILGFDLQNLAIKWRKLERDGWKFILSNKIQEIWCVESIILFKLLRDLTHGTLKTYLQECDIGVYEIRVIMLRQIMKYVAKEQRSLISQHLEQSAIFSENYNQQFGATIQGYIKEVAEYRKLVSWESKNYLIIQQTSHKMHSKLIKVQGRFRAYLNEKFEKLVIQRQIQDEFSESVDGFMLKGKQLQVVKKSVQSSHTSFHQLLQKLIDQSFERIEQLKAQKSNSKLAALKNFQEYIRTLLGLKSHQTYKEDNHLLSIESHPMISKAAHYYYKSVTIMQASILQIGKFVPAEYTSRSLSIIQDCLKKINHSFKLIRPLIPDEPEMNENQTQLIPQDYLNCFQKNDLHKLLLQFNRQPDLEQKQKLLGYIDELFIKFSEDYADQYHILRQLYDYLSTIEIKEKQLEQKQILQCNIEKTTIVFSKYMKNLETEENLLGGEIKLLNSYNKHGIDQSKLSLAIKNLEYSCKFLYFMTSVFCNIIVKGFCQKDEDQDENGEQNGEDQKDGTGIGEGKGQQNITKEIEYEEQLLGEQPKQDKPEDQEEENQDKKDEKQDEFDMKNDFEGKNQDPNQEEEQENEEEKDDEKNSLDEGFSSVNEDNEEMKHYQGSDEEDEQEQSEDKLNRKKSDIEFNADEEEQNEKKMSAKEEREQKQNNQKRNMKDVEQASHDAESQLEDEDEEIEESQEGEKELKEYAGKGGEQLESMDEEQQEDLENDQSNNENEEENISMNEEENQNQEEMPIEEEVKFDEPNMEQEPEKQDIDQDLMQKKPEQLDDQENNDEQNNENKNQLFTNQDDIENQMNEQAQDQGQQGEQGNENKDEKEQEKKEKKEKNQQMKGEEGGEAKMEMIKKLFQAMEQHLTKEDFANFKKDLNVHDSDEEQEDQNDGMQQENDFKISKDQIQNQKDQTTNLPTQFKQKEVEQIKREGEEKNEKGDAKNTDEKDMQKQKEEAENKEKIQENIFPGLKEQFNPQLIEIENKEIVEISIEDYIKQYYRQGFDVNTDNNLQKGLQLWPQLQQEVLESSIHLCEKLKSILVATQVSALKGDYKTGKRLNMKKIIPYIASNYRKDKIWLRRTQPQKRVYQILLALDDSLSMSENQVGYLSLQSLTSLSLALSKMEAGQIGIASIREGMSLLHDFNKPFTQLDCPLTLGQFNFQFESKQSSELSFMRFMRESIDKFKNIKQANAQQICFIMSDGKFNKKMVRPLIREAEELQIFYVFIILDKENQSITNIKSTHYVTVNEKQKIEIKNYLEDFPFRYYVIIKSPHELNHVLVNILRQYYQLFE